MRIYIISAHSCGKTTLARYISKTYNLPMITEVARAVLAEKELNIDTLRTNLDVADDYQEAIFFRQIQEEKKYKDFVSDRSFDNLTYAAQHSRILHNLSKTQEFSDYIENVKKDDVIIFYIRPHKSTIKSDGVRETLVWEGIIQIDAMIKFMLEFFGIDYININTDSMQERIRQVDTILKGK